MVFWTNILFGFITVLMMVMTQSWKVPLMVALVWILIMIVIIGSRRVLDD